MIGLFFAGIVANQPDAAQAGSSPTRVNETMAKGMPELIQTYLDSMDLTPAERGVLERSKKNGRIAPADYQDAQSRYAECMERSGFTPEFRESLYGFYVQLPFHDVSNQNALDAANVKCSRGMAAVDVLYRTQQANPKLLADSRLVAVECLESSGFVDGDYTVERFERDWLHDEFPFDASEPGPNDCLWGAGYGYFES
ncbi:hypothetical protein V5H98_07305 [Georgenia sp. M64]|uniref:hypothetical protein n=1 Tax=Georgenia sp. M64 TaxID=3120520 RepID=UPI0030E3A031